MLRLACLLAVSLGLWSPAFAQQGRPLSVTVASAAQERTARKLASAVLKALRSDSRFTLVENPSAATLTIALPTDVGWERRLDWTEIHYQARVTSAAGQSRVFAGTCWNFNLSVCAKQILDAAAGMGAA